MPLLNVVKSLKEMDLIIKSVILLLVLLKNIKCKDCTFHYGPDDHCNLSILCEGTSDIANIAASRRNYDCPGWRRRATFSDDDFCRNQTILKDKYQSITCSSCENSVVFGSFVEFEITNSHCHYLTEPAFAKFPNLEVIRLHNTNLREFSFDSHSFGKLVLLELSQSKITNINFLSIQRYLQILNVSYNIINTLNDEGFRFLPFLTKLDLTSNMIDIITPRTFYGLQSLKFISLSHNKISNINLAFEGLTSLEEIYLDHNALHEINEDYFKGLNKLMILKLDSNNINVIDWAVMENIPMIKVFDISNNGINNVNKTAFIKNNDINYVDFSFNQLTQLIPKTFLKKNISFFAMKNNLLKGGLEIGMFEGMTMVRELDLSHQRIEFVGDHAFYGLTRLTTLLLNDNIIQNISKKAFNSLEDLELLDLSNNMLHYIDLEHELNKLQILRFKNNLIADIGSNSFMEMHSLEFLDLSENNLGSFNKDTFDPILPHLKILNISHNSLKIIEDDLFNKFVNLTSLDLSHNSNLTIAYSSTKNTSLQKHVDIPEAIAIESVNMSNCNMDKVNFLMLNPFKKISSLNFFDNQLLKIEYGMFSSNKKLNLLDLSYNRISYIQPGSFKDNNELTVLNVSHNELFEIEYGSFQGLKTLSLLDISFNKIKSLKNGMFFETSDLDTLIADNNSIESVKYEDFAGAKITTLSIGGNPIPCLLLVNLKTETHSLQVTALKQELHLPNFKGIACSAGIQNNDKGILKENIDFERRDALLEDIRNILLEIKSANYSKTTSGSKSGDVSQMSNSTESMKWGLYQNEGNMLETNIEKPMQPTQTVLSILSDICLIFITVVILCLMLYKGYKMKLFSSFHRRRTTSTQCFTESIATASL